MSRSTYMQTLLSLPNYQKQPTVHWTKSIGQYTKPFQCWPQHSFNPYIKTSDFQQISKEKYSHGFKGASNPITYQYFTHAIVQMQFKRHIAFNTDKKFCTYIKGHMPDWHMHACTHAHTHTNTNIYSVSIYFVEERKGHSPVITLNINKFCSILMLAISFIWR